MMIRSMPPASAHLADRPVPGARADDHAARGERRAQLGARLVAGHRAASEVRVEPVGHRGRERGVVDVVQLDQLDRRSVEPLRSASNRPRRPPGRGTAGPGVEHRHAAERDEQAVGPGRGATACAAIRRPSSAHSSGVVRISVTDGLWT